MFTCVIVRTTLQLLLGLSTSTDSKARQDELYRKETRAKLFCPFSPFLLRSVKESGQRRWVAGLEILLERLSEIMVGGVTADMPGEGCGWLLNDCKNRVTDWGIDHAVVYVDTIYE